eukprot:COSAG02_NODE_2823_length_7948_cov_14.628105_4_plen_117_part_00
MTRGDVVLSFVRRIARLFCAMRPERKPNNQLHQYSDRKLEDAARAASYDVIVSGPGIFRLGPQFVKSAFQFQAITNEWRRKDVDAGPALAKVVSQIRTAATNHGLAVVEQVCARRQ